MRTTILTITLIAAWVFSVQANTYVDPRAPFDAKSFFEKLPTGQ